MTDNLRNRVAAVLREFLLAHFIVDPEQAQGLWPEHLADVVIEALALKREHLSGRDSLYVIAGDPRPIHRYVQQTAPPAANGRRQPTTTQGEVVSTARLRDTNVIPIWEPRDSVDTAQAFNAELANAERGISINRPWFISQSRERKARIYDGLAVALLMALMAALGVILFAASAKADPDSEAQAYAAEYGPAVCSVLDDYPSVSGMLGIMQAIVEDGMTEYQAGEVVGISIYRLCPEYQGLAEKFVQRYGGTSAVA